MVEIDNGFLAKPKAVNNSTFANVIEPLLTTGETITHSFKSNRDGIIFTTKRIICMNVQGITGKKVDYSSLPFNKIQAFSIETAGYGFDSELELWFSGLGKVKFEFSPDTDVISLCRLISEIVL